MAGIDVGSNNRWEYLLLGEPLSDVAVAESLAKKGELVISPSAHALLCGVPDPTAANTQTSPRKKSIPAVVDENAPPEDSETRSNSPNPQKVQQKSVRACVCERCVEPGGFFRVDPNIPLVEAVNTETPEELADYDLYFYSEIMERTTVAYREVMHQIDETVFIKVCLA